MTCGWIGSGFLFTGIAGEFRCVVLQAASVVLCEVHLINHSYTFCKVDNIHSGSAELFLIDELSIWILPSEGRKLCLLLQTTGHILM